MCAQRVVCVCLFEKVCRRLKKCVGVCVSDFECLCDVVV